MYFTAIMLGHYLLVKNTNKGGKGGKPMLYFALGLDFNK